MPVAQIQVQTILRDVFGTALGQLSGIVVQLCGYGSQVPRVSGAGWIAGTTPLAVEANAAQITFSVYGNDIITPAGTYYTISALDVNGVVIATDAYQFTGTANVDLSAAPTYVPDVATALTPIYPLIVLPYAPVIFFPALDVAVLTYKVVLTGNVTSSSMQTLLPGQEVIFDIEQDGVGGHTFAYPPNCFLGPTGILTVTPAPYAKTLSLFTTLNDGTLDAVLGAQGPAGPAGLPGPTGPPIGGVNVSSSIFNLAGVASAQVSPVAAVSSSAMAGMVAGQTYVLSVAWGATAYAVAWPAGLANSTPLTPVANTTVYQLIMATSATTAVAFPPLCTP